jgi:hypothetical protein
VTVLGAIPGAAPGGTLDDTSAVDLRRAPLADLRAIDFRSPERDFFADDAATWDRFAALWAGLDAAAWRLPGAAPSDAGGPDWSLVEHVAHVVDWQEIAIDYVGVAIETGRWPTHDDFDGGDWDRFNEGRRDRYAASAPRALRERAGLTHARLVEAAASLPPEVIRSDVAWGWIYYVLHGHRLDHLGVLEPWAARLRARQADCDPFGPDPQPSGPDIEPGVERFHREAEEVFAQFDELVRVVPFEAWTTPGPTPDWSLLDHVGHATRWFEEAADAIGAHRAGDGWWPGPDEGVDAWNAREVALLRGSDPADVLARFDAGRRRLADEIPTMTAADWRDPEGWSWAYDCYHGHLRAHLAMIGPWCARLGWPPA